MRSQKNPSDEKQFFSINECCSIIGIGRTKTYGLVKEGKLKLVKIGSRSLIGRKSLSQFIEELSDGN